MDVDGFIPLSSYFPGSGRGFFPISLSLPATQWVYPPSLVFPWIGVGVLYFFVFPWTWGGVYPFFPSVSLEGPYKEQLRALGLLEKRGLRGDSSHSGASSQGITSVIP